ncbi:hypothetical protein IFM89_034450 [Coptis chinensis]|uniref:Heparanase-like protein 1 n=1 Tax=Coptis chinensis TaxID=261450 RepID=A0A835MK11_9MAGN|nr:hypothetical protein IFM89_034450 [Coptis chinensis]
MGFRLSWILFFTYLSRISAQETIDATIVVHGAAKIAETDENFVCATIDWWPTDKCNYNHCPWGKSTALSLDLSHPILGNAIQAFDHLRIRVGGSLQDQVVYNVGTLKYPCHPFTKMPHGLFGFSKGCLPMYRWDELNHLFNKTGAIVMFGLNALYGRHKIIGGSAWGGAWDSSNAQAFMKYTISKGFQVDSWEFGNELSGSGIGASVGAEQYGKDMMQLNKIINELYQKSHPRPLLLAPGGFYDEAWYAKLLEVSGSGVVNVMTHHLYNLGSGDDPNLANKILDPHYLNRVSKTFENLQGTIKSHGPWASAWVGESGGAYNSGGRHVSNTFVNSFCALLWHRLMGKGVLAADNNSSPFLRVYAHCSKGRPGVTLLLINLSNQTNFNVMVRNNMNIDLHIGKRSPSEGSFLHGLKKSVSWIGRKASDGTLMREEYHLTPDGDLRSQTMALNGKPLQLTESGDIPNLDPLLTDVQSPLSVIPLSIAFIALPNFEAPGCV